MDKLSDGRRPISTERAGAGGSDPIKAAGDERGGSPGDREPWKAQASAPAALPIERSITDVARETERCSKDRPSSGSARRPGGAFADTRWQRSLSMARTTARQRK